MRRQARPPPCRRGEDPAPLGPSSLGRVEGGGLLVAGDGATRGGDPSAILPPPPITLGEGEVNWGREMGEFVYGDWGELLPNEGEGRMGEGEEEAGPKPQGEEGEAGQEGGSRWPMGTDEANAALDAEKGAPSPIDVQPGGWGGGFFPGAKSV